MLSEKIDFFFLAGQYLLSGPVSYFFLSKMPTVKISILPIIGNSFLSLTDHLIEIMEMYARNLQMFFFRARGKSFGMVLIGPQGAFPGAVSLDNGFDLRFCQAREEQENILLSQEKGEKKEIGGRKPFILAKS